MLHFRNIFFTMRVNNNFSQNVLHIWEKFLKVVIFFNRYFFLIKRMLKNFDEKVNFQKLFNLPFLFLVHPFHFPDGFPDGTVEPIFDEVLRPDSGMFYLPGISWAIRTHLDPYFMNLWKSKSCSEIPQCQSLSLASPNLTWFMYLSLHCFPDLFLRGKEEFIIFEMVFQLSTLFYSLKLRSKVYYWVKGGVLPVASWVSSAVSNFPTSYYYKPLSKNR